MLVTVSLH